MREIEGAKSRKVTVDRDKLLKVLVENRKKHVRDYEEAVAGYKHAAVEKINDEWEKAREKIGHARKHAMKALEDYNPEKSDDLIVFCGRIAFELRAPRCHEDAYVQAIEMMMWETKEEVELSAEEFRCFVMDKWDWSEEFLSISAQYHRMKGDQE